VKRALRLLLLSLLALIVTAGIALALIVKLVLAPSAGEWSAEVGPPVLRLTVGVPTTIRLATSPWFAPHLAGRSIDTAHGTLHFDWREATQSLALRCGPCVLDVPALGAQPIRVAQLSATVRRDGHLLNGRFEATPAGDAEPPLAGRWDGRLSQKGLQLAFDVDDAPIARWYGSSPRRCPS
jgi:penicillin-binding protein 1A